MQNKRILRRAHIQLLGRMGVGVVFRERVFRQEAKNHEYVSFRTGP